MNQPQHLLLRSLLIELNLMHKFTKNGSFVRAFDEKVRRFFESRLMRTCSRIAPPLPATLSAPLYHLNNELVYYRDQVLNILELQHAMITVRRNMNIVPMILFTEFVFLTQFDSPYMREANIEGVAPSFLEWYRWIGATKRGIAKAVRSRIEDYQQSRSLLSHTPTETSWRYKAEIYEKKVPPRPSNGCIQIDFFSTLEAGRYRPGVLPAPDYTTFEVVYTSYGVDLRSVREKLGIESLAIITDKGPFRPTFELAQIDRLSPIAVLDLTKEFTQPIRVFEPRVANATRAARAVRVPVYLAWVLIASLVLLLCGAPSPDTTYLGVLYGQPFARAYASAGRATTAARAHARNGTHFVARCVLAMCVVPFMTLLAGLCAAWNVGVSVLSAASAGARTVVSAALGLDTKGWLIAGFLCWFTAAEIYSCIH